MGAEGVRVYHGVSDIFGTERVNGGKRVHL